MKACFRAALVVILLGFLATGSAWAQGTGSLTGTVSDPTGAVVPGADVKLTSETTGLTRTTTTASNGVYVFPLLPPATYKVEVSAQGFKTAVREHLAVQVGLTSTFDVRLEIGAIAETVEVTAGAAPINTTDASLGVVINELQIRSIPLEARSIVGLLSLQPGAVFLPTGDPRSGSISGSRSDQSNITLDGVDVNDPENQTAAYQSSLRMTVESTQEFRSSTSNYGADKGRSSAAQVELITKTGTNEIHGALYWAHRNTATSSNEYFNKLAKNKTPKLNKHIFGASAGGPLVKNRWFVFGNFEGLKESSEDVAVRSVPSMSLRDGVLIYRCASAAACPGGTVQGLTATHTVPAAHFGLTPAQFAAIDPLGIGPSLAGVAHFRKYAVPNEPGRDGIGGTTIGNIVGFRFTAPIKNDFRTYIMRSDFKIDPAGKHNLFWRGNLQDDVINAAPQFPGFAPNTKRLINSKGMALGYDAVLRPNIVNSFRYGYTRIKDEIAGLRTSSQVFFRFLSDIPASSTSSARRTPTHNFRDDLTWITGAHTMQFGANVRYTRIPRFSTAGSYHTVSINPSWVTGIGRRFMPGRATCTTPGCSAVPAVAGGFAASWADTSLNLWGLLTQGNARYNFDRTGRTLPVGAPVARRYASDEYEFYLQDTWRLRPSFTLTLGLRYNVFSPPWETDGNQVAPTPGFRDYFKARESGMYKGIPSNAHAGISYDLAGPANGGKGFYPWDWNNFAPRISWAWSPHFREGIAGRLFGDGKTAIRSGYSLVYDRIGLALARAFDTGTGAFGMSTTLVTVFGSVDERTAPRFTGVNSIPGSPVIRPSPGGGFPFPASKLKGNFGISSSIDDGNVTPYAHMYDFSIARELPHDITVEAAYVGRRANKLLVKRDLAMILDLHDPVSGMSYFKAASLLAQFAEEGDPFNFTVGRDTRLVPTIPYWENLFPGMAGNPLCDIYGTGAASTATQAVYDLFLCVAPDYTTALQLLDQDINCIDFGSCSRFGPFAYFNDQFAALAGASSIGFSYYDALQISVRKRYTHGSQFDFNYTWAHSLDITSDVERGDTYGEFFSGGYTGFLVNPWNARTWYGNSDFDVRQQINFNGLYELPFGRGKSFGGGLPGWANHIVGGWRVSGLFRWTSGFPFNVINCRSCWPTNWNLQGNASVFTKEPVTRTTRNAVGGRPSPFAKPTDAIKAFRRSRPGEVGLRNVMRGDGYFSIDFRLGKSWNLPWEGHQLSFAWDTFNVTNTPTFNTGNVTMLPDISASFGRYDGTLAACDGRAGRCMQFGLRYQF